MFHKLLDCEMIFISNIKLIHLLMTQPTFVRRVKSKHGVFIAHSLMHYLGL